MSFIEAQGLSASFKKEAPLHLLITDSHVVRFLRRFGYRYVLMGTWWEPTRFSAVTDMNVNSHDELSEFELMRCNMTPLRALNDTRYAQWERARYKVDQIDKVIQMKGPVFVMAHMLVTHPPYVFNRDGSFLTTKQARTMSPREHYLEAVRYANRSILDMITAILSNSDPAPIIIIQADEGPWPDAYYAKLDSYDWATAPKDDVEEKMGILNAIYFPDGDYSRLSATMTPVDTFRLVADKYFGTQLGLLPDQSYLSEKRDSPYALFKISR